MHVGTLPKLLDQCRRITSNRSRWFNIKTAMAHHSIIQKEVDELLARGSIEPSTGGTGFYFNIFVVLKHTGGLQPIFNL